MDAKKLELHEDLQEVVIPYMRYEGLQRVRKSAGISRRDGGSKQQFDILTSIVIGIVERHRGPLR